MAVCGGGLSLEKVKASEEQMLAGHHCLMKSAAVDFADSPPKRLVS